jgi:dihydrodipicolinate synthase/N-acetylneuraminate lyase
MSAPEPFAGVFPIAPTPFTDSGGVDLDGQRRVLDCMIDRGVDGMCIFANYSEQFALADRERETLLDLCLVHVAGRVPASGRRADAQYARILPLVNSENRQCGLRATKAVMVEGGVIKIEVVRHPLPPLHPATRAGLLELARAVEPLALRWGR